MVNRYIELTDPQQGNLFFFLDKAQSHQINKLRKDFEFKYGKNRSEARDNILHGLMMEEINFLTFMKWISQLYLEGNNTLFIYESDNDNTFKKINEHELFNSWVTKTVPLYNINVETITEITLVDVGKYENQVMFTYAAPSYVVQQRLTGEVPVIQKDVYLAYINVDFKTQQVILSMHPTNNLYSIGGIKKRKDLDNLAPQFINFFRKQVLPFNFADPDWILDALFDITEEYFDHNNPIIYKKMQDFENNELEKITEIVSSKEECFNSGSPHLRLKKALKEFYEMQLIGVYGAITKETPFKVFLHEAGKGVTSFKADSRGKALSFADSYEIVKKMIENADISSLGITYVNNGREFPYKIMKEATYYSLKRITTAVTEKEIVDHVLRQLKQYKQGEEIPDSSGKIESHR